MAGSVDQSVASRLAYLVRLEHNVQSPPPPDKHEVRRVAVFVPRFEEHVPELMEDDGRDVEGRRCTKYRLKRQGDTAQLQPRQELVNDPAERERIFEEGEMAGAGDDFEFCARDSIRQCF